MTSPEKIIQSLISDLEISRSILASLLDITTSSLNSLVFFDNELKNSKKANSLLRLHSFVSSCIKLNLPSAAIINFLVSPIDLEGFNENTPLYYIIEDQSNISFDRDQQKIIQSFIDSLKFQNLFNL